MPKKPKHGYFIDFALPTTKFTQEEIKKLIAEQIEKQIETDLTDVHNVHIQLNKTAHRSQAMKDSPKKKKSGAKKNTK
jgi:hypothetical protein